MQDREIILKVDAPEGMGERATVKVTVYFDDVWESEIWSVEIDGDEYDLDDVPSKYIVEMEHRALEEASDRDKAAKAAHDDLATMRRLGK